MKRLTAITLLALMTLSLWGCGKKHILDGPGMVNDQPWKGFTLSRTDSNSRYHFRFSVESTDFAYVLTGQCHDAEGNLYTLEEGVELSAEDLQFLRSLWLGDLEDAPPENATDGQDPHITLVLTWVNDTRQEKVITSEMSILIYEQFLPYFTNN